MDCQGFHYRTPKLPQRFQPQKAPLDFVRYLANPVLHKATVSRMHAALNSSTPVLHHALGFVTYMSLFWLEKPQSRGDMVMFQPKGVHWVHVSPRPEMRDPQITTGSLQASSLKNANPQ